MNKTEKIKVGYLVSDVYQYLKNLKNYSEKFGNCRVSPDGLVATTDAPLIGEVRVVMLERVMDSKVVVSAKKLGMKLTADLKELSESETEINLSMTVNPDLGLIKNRAIQSFAPTVFNKIVGSLETANFEAKKN